MRRIMVALLVTSMLAGAAAIHAAEPVSFRRTTIDLGAVVSDLEKSVRFYTEGIGFRELKGFDVSADVAAGAGLTDSKPLSIRVLVLGEGPEATKLKLMQVAGASPRTGDTDFIHSHTGFRYLTISRHGSHLRPRPRGQHRGAARPAEVGDRFPGARSPGSRRGLVLRRSTTAAYKP